MNVSYLDGKGNLEPQGTGQSQYSMSDNLSPQSAQRKQPVSSSINCSQMSFDISHDLIKYCYKNVKFVLCQKVLKSLVPRLTSLLDCLSSHCSTDSVR